MRRILLRVSYDGKQYHGWQLQPNSTTVEGVLNKVISEFTQTDTKVIGASRTDAGVHAYGNVAVFDTCMRMPAEKFAPALNTYLPSDIIIQESVECPTDFHPRKVNCRKTYEYTILARKTPLPEYNNYAYHFHKNLDTELMRRGAIFFKGRHDFKAFCSAHTTTKTTIRTIYDIDIKEEKLSVGGRLIKIYVTGNGFLYNMVRIIAGTLLEVGTGKREPKNIVKLIKEKDREAAGPTAPPQGLKLLNINFGKHLPT